MTDEKKAEFEELLIKNRIPIERYINYKLQSAQYADDVIQNTFLAAYRSFETLRDVSLFKWWLLKIAKNECTLFYRKQSKLSTISIDDVSEQVFAARDEFTEKYSGSEMLSKLEDRDAKILTLFLLEERSQHEIADRLHIPIGTVKSRIYYAKRRFAELYGAENMKGIKKMKNTLNFPLIMPELQLIRKDVPFFEVRYEDDCFIIPKLGNKSSWASYQYPQRELITVSTSHVSKKAVIHGVEGVKINRDTYNVKSDYFGVNEAIWFTQLTDEYIRSLGVIQSDGDDDYPTKVYTFLEEEYDIVCNGNDRVHGMPVMIIENPLQREGEALQIALYNTRYTDGVYAVTIGKRTFETIKFVWVQQSTILTDTYVDRNGRTILTRWYEPTYWMSQERQERFKPNATCIVNGMEFAHIEDRIGEYVL